MCFALQIEAPDEPVPTVGEGGAEKLLELAEDSYLAGDHIEGAEEVDAKVKDEVMGCLGMVKKGLKLQIDGLERLEYVVAKTPLRSLGLVLDCLAPTALDDPVPSTAASAPETGEDEKETTGIHCGG